MNFYVVYKRVNNLVSFFLYFQVFKKLHLGTVAYTPETVDEVRMCLDL